MRFLRAISLALCASQTIAHSDIHGDAPMPRLVGARRFLKDLRGERRWEQRVRSAPTDQATERRNEGGLRKRGEIEERQNNGRCGSRYGSCSAGYCCSYEGYCGKDAASCSAPDCQINYGPGCDGNQKPSGVDTSTIARPKVGNVAYGGVGIYDCVNDGDIAMTFDDGPWEYTNDLLDKLAKYQAKATFFITGNNLHKGQINDRSTPWPNVIQRMAAEGHQIASHTWSHENYSQLTTTQFRNQIYWNEIAINDILGYFPTYMRPPFSICPSNTCGSQLATMGYHAIYFDLDTEGYLHDDPSEIQISKDIWDDAVPGTNPCRNSFLQIEHDIHEQTVYNLTDYVLDSLFKSGYRSVTVGQCLGDPPANWYRAGSKAVPSYTFKPRAPTGTWSCLSQSSTSPPGPTNTLVVSQDGNCGSGVTCQGSKFGNCCSQNNFCGSSIDYCGTGCNPQFGTCTNGDSPLPGDDPLPTTTTSGTSPTGTPKVSIDGSCGNGVTCDGSGFGTCCSQYGFCGSTDDYCGTGCQPAFGSGCKVRFLSHVPNISVASDSLNAILSNTALPL
ncbi:carbohydrate esterase family 4 protein [Xylaria bambusicola]|uniref:carbohydrate esterase family 4 protein n=1 Tax=Xylaria bambusicola TaxID=326684 RepID=UPI0020073459|nr:carbohydrate esterase family 4 protein [Xylaria bambusicola]KAI0528113.1 carbohydrate esterase family 4 protein [Xylaria bambusicola]